MNPSDPTRPTIRQLEYLVALSETLNFREAAERCHVSQPALSAQIRELEKLLGVTLFERDSRRVLATETGTVFSSEARSILEALDGAVSVVRSGGRKFARPIRFGAIPTIAPYALPDLLAIAAKRAPELSISFREERTAEIVERLSEGRLDVALVALEADLGRGLVQRRVGRDPFWVALPPDHSLAKKKQIAESDLDGQPVLLLDDGHCLREQSLSLCRRARAIEKGDFRAASLRTLLQLVEAGVGLTLIPELSRAAETSDTSRVVVRPFQKQAPSRTLGLVWRDGSPRAEEFEEIATWLEDLFPQA